MAITGQSTSVLGPGYGPVKRHDSLGNMVVSPRYYDLVQRGVVFTAANSAALALSINSTTATGFIITNPAASGKNIAILEICIALASAPGGAATLILTGNAGPTPTVTHTTPLTIRNALFGGSASAAVALVDSAATVPALTIVRYIGGGPVAGSSITAPFIRDEIAGAVTMAPGSVLSVQALTTAITAGMSMTWAELPT